MTDLHKRYAESLMNTFGPPKLVLTRGEGASVWDDAGKQYLDLLGGIAVNSLGHAHPALVDAVTNQLQTLGHVSNFFATEPQVRLAERLLDLLLSVVEERASASVSKPRREARSSSPTPAPRPTRPRSSSPGGPAAPTWSPPRAPSTAAPWVRSR